MGAEPIHDWGAIAASALEWWRDAGVDALVDDEVRDWLARPAPAPAPATTVPAVAEPVVETLPDTLEAFLAWRLGDDAPEADWLSQRIGPSGPGDAEWVVLTDMPEAEDSDALMTGPGGRLLDRILAAVGLGRDSVHIAALAIARPLAGRIPPEHEARLAMLMRHQLSLIRPKRLLLLGQAASRVLDETNGAAPDHHIHDVNHFGARTAVVASYHPRFLLERPAAKSEAWKHLLLLSRGLAE